MKIIIEFSWIVLLLNSNFFAGFATILTGLIAYLIFLQQKKEERLKAAKIILVEINDCESLFDSIKQNGVINLTNIRQLPFDNSWSKYKHNFAKILSEKDLKLIDNFYGACVLINKELNEAYSLPDYWREKGRIVAEKHAEYSEKSADKNAYEQMKKQTELFEKDDYWWQPFGPSKLIVDRIKTLQYITTTVTGERLRKIVNI